MSKVAIDTSFHMSYPYLLEYNDHIYCVPEMHAANEIGLYKAENFPFQWSKVSTLISDFGGVDSTIFQYDGKWWLFATDENDGPNLKLRVFYASDLMGPWKPHAGNPVKVDIRSSRPAGTPFVYDNNLYRPSQDCSKSYGGKIAINRIKRLTPDEFEEETTLVIEPSKKGPYNNGVHTISAAGDSTLIDGFQYVFMGRNIYMFVDRMRVILSNNLNRLKEILKYFY